MSTCPRSVCQPGVPEARKLRLAVVRGATHTAPTHSLRGNPAEYHKQKRQTPVTQKGASHGAMVARLGVQLWAVTESRNRVGAVSGSR